MKAIEYGDHHILTGFQIPKQLKSINNFPCSCNVNVRLLERDVHTVMIYGFVEKFLI